MVGGGMVGIPSTWNFWSTGPRWSEIADFQPIFDWYRPRWPWM